MKYTSGNMTPISIFFMCGFLLNCTWNDGAPTKEQISQVNLKRGAVISCNPAGEQFGSVSFDMSCNENSRTDFNLAISLLHSFEYDESEKVFAKIIDEYPNCAMAYWGVAMCNFHPLWTPPSPAELVKGSKAINIAKGIKNKSNIEKEYIDAIAVFYTDWDKTDHRTRCINYENAMKKIHDAYPGEPEAAIFYALSLDAAASPADKTYAKQKQAGKILNTYYAKNPNHPGIIHYLIHTFDYPSLAQQALEPARKYAQVAPSSAHALHMPSHIFTRLGLWDECIRSNIASVASAKCYAEQAALKGHWDEELHGLDYLVYAYLQKGDNAQAEKQLAYLQNFKQVEPVNFKVAYAFAAIPSRVSLENKNWKHAAALTLSPVIPDWKKFHWQESIIHFSRLLGNAHQGNISQANTELEKIQELHNYLLQKKDEYQAGQVAILLKSGSGWIKFVSGQKVQGINDMQAAADMEDATEKHPVTPGAILPARELLADMLMLNADYSAALQAYEAVLEKSPNRFNSLYGAGTAADKLGDKQKAGVHYKQLLKIVDVNASGRPEVKAAQAFTARL